jgi:hypothetical protein
LHNLRLLKRVGAAEPVRGTDAFYGRARARGAGAGARGARYTVAIALHTDHCPPADVVWLLYPLLADSAGRVERRERPLPLAHVRRLNAPLDENLRLSAALLDRCRELDIVLEVECGVVGGEEDGIGDEAVGRDRLLGARARGGSGRSLAGARSGADVVVLYSQPLGDAARSGGCQGGAGACASRLSSRRRRSSGRSRAAGALLTPATRRSRRQRSRGAPLWPVPGRWCRSRFDAWCLPVLGMTAVIAIIMIIHLC